MRTRGGPRACRTAPSPMLGALRLSPARRVAAVVLAAAVLALAGCGSGGSRSSTSATTSTTTSSSSTTATTNLPGTGRPQITIGDKNFTEQFVLGELYYQALTAQGYSVLLNRNIGPTEVTIQDLQSGRVSMYPEYIDTWNTSVAGYKHGFAHARSAYRAGARWAQGHGFQLLKPTPFGDTDAIAVTFNDAVHNNLTSIGDLTKIALNLTLGGPLQFQQSPSGLPGLEQVYGVTPATFRPLAIGDQYQALDQGTVQAADVNTTDGQLITGNYALLSDPKHVFGWGNVVPVAPERVTQAEGPAFAATIDRVSALLTTPVMRQLNAAVDVSGEDPKVVAQQFLAAHGLIPQPTG
jgi:osmoprotectant transport system substrate-binding protein